MNGTVKELFERKSVRAYSERKITEEEKRLIFEAALQAPTAGNMCLYSIIDVTDEALKKRLSETCDNQPFIATAPLVAVFCADFQRWYDVFSENVEKVRKPEEGDLFLAMADTFIAAQNSVTAAESMGIGSCYIGDILENYELHRELLKLPKYVLPVCLLCFGYPTEQQKKREKPPRFKVEDVVSENGYKAVDFGKLLSERQGFSSEEAFHGWLLRFCERKWNCDFGNEMNRSVKAMLESFAKEEN